MANNEYDNYPNYTFHLGSITFAEKTEIIEKRAPTDDSIRLLREMEEKVRNEVIKSIDVTNNIFNGKLFYCMDYQTLTHKLMFVYTINGKKYTTTNNIFSIKDKNGVIMEFLEQLSQDIARELLIPHLSVISKELI